MKLSILILFLFFLSMVRANDCVNNWDRTKTSIDDLREEVICSNNINFTECLDVIVPPPVKPYVFNPTPQQQATLAKEKGENCNCSSAKLASPLPTLTGPVATLMKGIDHNLSPRKYVNSLVDFYYHTQLHRRRIMALLDEAYKVTPELFEDITKDQMKILLSIHDLEKVDPNALGINGKPFYRELYDVYGTYKPHPESDPLIQKLNAAGEINYKAALKKAKLVIDPSMTEVEKKAIQTKIELAKKIEKYLDHIDRIGNKVSPEEFGKKTMYPLQNVEAKFKGLTDYLTAHYNKIIKDHDFIPLTIKQRFNIATDISIKESLSHWHNPNPNNIALNSVASLSRVSIHDITKILDNPRVKTGMLIVDGVLLMGTPSPIACSSSLGFHGWIEDSEGRCQPVPGLGPEMTEFLMMAEEDEKAALQLPTQCLMFQKTKELQDISRFEKVECSKNSLTLIPNRSHGSIQVNHHDGKIDSIKFSDALVRNTSSPFSTLINYDENRNEKEVCFEKTGVGSYQKCYEIEKIKNLDNQDRLKLHYEKLLQQRKELSFFIAKEIKNCFDQNK